jgi:hypothetical protein
VRPREPRAAATSARSFTLPRRFLLVQKRTRYAAETPGKRRSASPISLIRSWSTSTQSPTSAISGARRGTTGDKVQENTLTQVPSASHADFATETANPPAFAAVSSEATIDSSYSKSVASVKEGSLAGIYCVLAAGFNPRGAQVTPRFSGEGDVTAYVRIGGTADCPAPGVEVQTFEAGTRTRELFIWRLIGRGQPPKAPAPRSPPHVPRGAAPRRVRGCGQ